jgi:tetratricopeptide (TPR) repeat protein
MSIAYYPQTLQIAQELHDKAGQGRALGNMGSVYYSLGEYDKALEHYQQLVQVAQELHDKAGQGSALGNMGSVGAPSAGFADCAGAARQGRPGQSTWQHGQRVL